MKYLICCQNIMKRLIASSNAFQETPSTTNPLGAKAIGECGTIGAPATIANAVVDALRPLGVTHIDMPLTSQVIWRAIQAADGKG